MDCELKNVTTETLIKIMCMEKSCNYYILYDNKVWEIISYLCNHYFDKPYDVVFNLVNVENRFESIELKLNGAEHIFYGTDKYSILNYVYTARQSTNNDNNNTLVFPKKPLDAPIDCLVGELLFANALVDVEHYLKSMQLDFLLYLVELSALVHRLTNFDKKLCCVADNVRDKVTKEIARRTGSMCR